MKLASRLKVYATTLLMIAAVGFWYTSREGPTGGKNKNEDDNWMLSVTWKPGALSLQNRVHIVVKVDGFALPPYWRHISPFGETMTTERGARVELSASTGHPGLEFMDCIILRNGVTVPSTGFDSITHPGSVRCHS
jgi:hypothetical protein